MHALRTNEVDLLVDVRQRRGVRGPIHAFANAGRLDVALGAAGIAVQVWKDFAPTTAIRSLQKSQDAELGVPKSERSALGKSFEGAYLESILGPKDITETIARLDGFSKPVFLCVERKASACHRHLLADWLAAAAQVDVINIEP